MTSPVAIEEISGVDGEAVQEVPAARRADRLPLKTIVVAESDDELRARLGHPSVEAVWTARARMPAPTAGQDATNAVRQADPSVPLAYASADSTIQPERDPFRIIDENAERTGHDQQAIVPMPLPRPQVEQDDEEDTADDSETVPVPLPRPRNLPAVAAAPLPPGSPAQGAPVQLMATPPTRASVMPSLTTGPASSDPPAPRIQLASLPSSTERDLTRQGPQVMTPFGIPYTLQIDSVQTSCFPPALVELLRRIEDKYHQKPIVTSGYRDHGRAGSLHRRCMAADIMVPGVSASQLARDARSIPGMGGVGQYCHPNLVHVDIGTPRDWKYGCGSFFAMRDGSVSRGRVPYND